jgi:hypothetical protein
LGKTFRLYVNGIQEGFQKIENDIAIDLEQAAVEISSKLSNKDKNNIEINLAEINLSMFSDDFKILMKSLKEIIVFIKTEPKNMNAKKSLEISEKALKILDEISNLKEDLNKNKNVRKFLQKEKKRFKTRIQRASQML